MSCSLKIGNFQRVIFFGSTCPAVSVVEGIGEIAVLKPYFQVELFPNLTNAIKDII